MERSGKRLIGALVVLVIVAAVMLALTFTVDAIHDVAKGIAAERMASLGQVGIVIAGLFAPIVYVLKRLRLGLFGSSKEERALAARTDELEREIKRLRAEVAGLDKAREQELSVVEARVRELEGGIAASLQALKASDAAIDALIDRLLNPQRTKTDAELWEVAGSSPFFDPGVELTEGGRP